LIALRLRVSAANLDYALANGRESSPVGRPDFKPG
jgi:hypothetical protein